MKKNLATAYIAVSLAMIFWSFTFIWYKKVYQFYNPITTVFFRLIISSVFLFALMYPLRRIEKIKQGDFKYFLLVAVFNPFLYFIGESYGVKLVSSTLSAVIIATIPLFTSFTSSVFLNERMTRMNLTGIVLSIVGVSFIIFEKNEGIAVSPLGIAMLMLAVVAAIGYSMVLKKLSYKYSSITIVSYHNLIGIFLFAPLFFIFDFNGFKQTGLSQQAWVPLLELAFFGSSFAFIFFTFAIKRIGVGKANAFTNLIPVLTAILAFFLLGEMINIIKVVGISLVIGGLFLSQVKTSGLRERIRNYIRPSE
ncbi:MAG: DMT family transporter [Bacteroidales bacterium]|jgi:drug/metabolite transporter (DMT)-like permease|nr:DMT family transporter [Bacteroidales bacterium]